MFTASESEPSVGMVGQGGGRQRRRGSEGKWGDEESRRESEGGKARR